ncbi:Regulator of chromosome condensation (RCC1) family protein [Striga hermonthica]|uniref:Regulator of chromosome condensation (RCC1) family protein n=1 Tax=Striga hermonthica TaxID=68872 RepID=A0A9N7MYY4_STRHE|nr:Regulator of chromosome condensation (RCC1) family protein [Striga hermonthica]
MDATASGPSSVQYHNITEQAISSLSPQPIIAHTRQTRHCFGNVGPGEFPLSANPSIVLHVLTACNLDPQDLAKLEATCWFFKQPANFSPENELSLAELAALDMCRKRAVFKSMTIEQSQDLKQMCGGSWKLVLRYLLAGELCYRREKAQAIAGPGHSLVVTNGGSVYTFGSNSSGQLGHGNTDEESRPRLIRSLQGIRIIHAAAGPSRTMLISDTGRVYAFGKESFGEAEYTIEGNNNNMITTPRLVDSLKDIFVVQAAMGNFFTAVLSREGRVHTFSWGKEEKLGHQMDLNDVEPRPLLGPLENVPVVQIAAGYCYLLALACQPSGMPANVLTPQLVTSLKQINEKVTKDNLESSSARIIPNGPAQIGLI